MTNKAPGFLVSSEFLTEQRNINSLVRTELGYGIPRTMPQMKGAIRPDIRLVRTPPDGIKGARYNDPVIYGAACRCVEIYDSVNMVDELTKDERRLRYIKRDTTYTEEFVLNPSINPVPGYQIIAVDVSVGGEFVVIGHEWELPAIVAEDFSEPDTYNRPVVATVHVLAPTGDTTVDEPETQTYQVTPYVLKVVVRGKGLNLDKGIPCRIKTVNGVWMFSWVDCEIDDELKAQIEMPDDYPDVVKLEELEE